MSRAPGTGWYLFTAVYLFWTAFFVVLDVVNGSSWAILQIIFLGLASYWFYRVWVLRKPIKLPFTREW